MITIYLAFPEHGGPRHVPRIATVKRGDNTNRYLRIVEAYRVDGRTSQRVVANLGRLDQLDGKLDDLLLALSKYAKGKFVRGD